jgi:hypothetical protein
MKSTEENPMSDTENKVEDDANDEIEVVEVENPPKNASKEQIEPQEGIQELKMKLEQEQTLGCSNSVISMWRTFDTQKSVRI